ncbi:MAG: galactokinase [Actinomycetota bacterium]
MPDGGEGLLEAAEIEERRAEFESRFGEGTAADLYFAPGRVNLMGDHTDYNGGLVLPLAIAEGTYVLIRPRDVPPSRLYSATTGEAAEFDPMGIDRRGDWADYVRGVFFILSLTRGEPPPCDAMFFSNLPLGAGLSSSASLEIAAALAASSLGLQLPPEEAAQAAWRAENEFVGMNCGVMDQYAVALSREGHLILLDCRTLAYDFVPFDLPGTSLLIGHTGTGRSLVDSQYNQRRRECEEALGLMAARLGPRDDLSAFTMEEFQVVRDTLPEVSRMRAEHVLRENARVREAAASLQAGDPERLGRLMNESHASLRDLYGVSSPELDSLQEISLAQPGVWGCRMTGAGFGGCVIALARDESLPAYLAGVPGLYREASGREPFFISARPCAGARRLA